MRARRNYSVGYKYIYIYIYIYIYKVYFWEIRGYVIYSPRAQPEVNESHIHELPKNSGLIFHMGGVSKLWCKTMVKILMFSI